MKKIAVSACLVLGLSTAAHATLIEILPFNPTVTLGDSVDLEIRISGLGDGVAPSLGTYDLDVLYDGSVLQLQVVSIGDPVLGDQLNLSGLGTITSIAFGIDSVNLFELSLDAASDLENFQAGAFTLATLTYRAIGVGLGSVTLNVNALGDAVGDPLDFDATGASVTVPDVQQTPEPIGLTLLPLGVAAICGLRRRR